MRSLDNYINSALEAIVFDVATSVQEGHISLGDAARALAPWNLADDLYDYMTEEQDD